MAEKILIASGKGGVGKSSITSGLGLALEHLGKKVLIIDMDISLGCIDLILGIGETGVFTWGDLVLENCAMEKAVRHSQGLDVLIAPRKNNDLFTGENICKMVNYFDNSYDFILMDCPAGLSDGVTLAAQCADGAFVIATPDNVSVRAAAGMADFLYDSGIQNVNLIINRFVKKQILKGLFLNIDDVIDAAGVQLIGIVPNDRMVAQSAVIGMREFSPEFPAMLAFERVARRMCKERISLKV